MAISVSVKKFSGREYVYICESFRDPITRRPTSRVLHSFGRKDKLLEENPNAMELIEEQAQKLRANTDAYHQTLEQRVGAGIRMTPLDAKISFRDKSLYWSHGKCDTLKNSKTTLFPAF